MSDAGARVTVTETSRPSYSSDSEQTRSGLNHSFHFPKEPLLSPQPDQNLLSTPQPPGAELGDCLCLPPHLEAQLLTITLITLCQQHSEAPRLFPGAAGCGTLGTASLQRLKDHAAFMTENTATFLSQV